MVSLASAACACACARARAEPQLQLQQRLRRRDWWGRRRRGTVLARGVHEAKGTGDATLGGHAVGELFVPEGKARPAGLDWVRVPMDRHVEIPLAVLIEAVVCDADLADGLEEAEGVQQVEACLRMIHVAEAGRTMRELLVLEAQAVPAPGPMPQRLSDAERCYVEGVVGVLEEARYDAITPRDVEVSVAINGRDYLTQTFVRANPNGVGTALRDAGVSGSLFLEGGSGEGEGASKNLDRDDRELYPRVLLYKRGYGVERTRGTLLLQKFDYLQTLPLMSLRGAVTGVVRRPLSRLVDWGENLLRSFQLYPNVPKDLGVLTRLGDAEHEHGGRRGARYISALSSSEAFSVEKLFGQGPGGFWAETELTTPTLKQVVMLNVEPDPAPPRTLFPKGEGDRSSGMPGARTRQRSSGMSPLSSNRLREQRMSDAADTDPESSGSAVPIAEERLTLQKFRDVPWSGLRLVFPSRRVVFRPLELVRIDILFFIAIITIGVRVKFVGGRPPPDQSFTENFLDAIEIGVQDTVVNAVALATLVAILGRVAFALWQNLNKVELQVSSLINSKRTTSQQQCVRQLCDEAGLQRTKEAFLAYAFLRASPCTVPELSATVAAWLASTFGSQLDFQAHDAVRELLRLGILAEEPGSDHAQPIRVLPPDASVASLKRHWASVLDAQLQRADD